MAIGFIETAAVAAALSFSWGANVFTFPDTGVAVGDIQVVQVAHHNSIGEFPAQPGWIKLNENQYPEGGPRVATFLRKRQAGDAEYVFVSAPAAALDVRAAGSLVAVSSDNPVTFKYGAFQGSYSFADWQQFAPPVGIPTANGDPDTLFIWMAFDNTREFNHGPEGYITAGAGWSMPHYVPVASETPVTIQLLPERNASIGNGTAHDVLYAGSYVRLTAKVRPLSRKKE